MSKPFKCEYTKDQLRHLYAAWGCGDTALVPTKNRVTVIAFPPGRQYNMARISKSAMKSTYGKALYEVILYNQEPA